MKHVSTKHQNTLATKLDQMIAHFSGNGPGILVQLPPTSEKPFWSSCFSIQHTIMKNGHVVAVQSHVPCSIRIFHGCGHCHRNLIVPLPTKGKCLVGCQYSIKVQMNRFSIDFQVCNVHETMHEAKTRAEFQQFLSMSGSFAHPSYEFTHCGLLNVAKGFIVCQFHLFKH